MKIIGDRGEYLVSLWLQNQGFKILARNWSCKWGELDLVAQELSTKTISFVEVKTRSVHNWDNNGILAVDQLKQEKISRTALLYLAKYPQLENFPCRFDVALVTYQLSNCDRDPDSITLSEKTVIQIGQAVFLGDRNQFTLQHYLPSAFELAY